ncbi:MAG: hypothetical protein ACLR7D_07730 [Lachnospira eligens]
MESTFIRSQADSKGSSSSSGSSSRKFIRFGQFFNRKQLSSGTSSGSSVTGGLCG